MLHDPEGPLPCGTAAWLALRPNLSRHHHVRLSGDKAQADLARCGQSRGCLSQRQSQSCSQRGRAAVENKDTTVGAVALCCLPALCRNPAREA